MERKYFFYISGNFLLKIHLKSLKNDTGIFAIAEKVPTKSIKRNSIGLPIEISELIRQKRDTRGDFGKGPEYRSTRLTLIRKRDSWKMYCDDMELSDGQDAAWCKISSVF